MEKAEADEVRTSEFVRGFFLVPDLLLVSPWYHLGTTLVLDTLDTLGALDALDISYDILLIFWTTRTGYAVFNCSYVRFSAAVQVLE